MPNARTPAPPWVTPPRNARAVALLVAAWRRLGDRSIDPGTPQRSAARRQALAAFTGPAIPQRVSANPSPAWVDATRAPFTVPPALGIDAIDPVAGISSYGAGRAARILGAKTRAPIRAQTGAAPIDPVEAAERMPRS